MFCARAHMRSKLPSNASTVAGSVIKIASLSWLASPDREKLPEPVRNTVPIDGVGFQMHQNALAFDPRGDIGMGEQRFDKPSACRSVLGELRFVQIEADDDAAFRRVGQRLDDSRVG